MKSINELIKEMSNLGFGAGRLVKAIDIFEKMVKENSKVFLTLSGALVPAGMRKILSDLIRDGLVDVLISTGANVTHDLSMAFGEEFKRIEGDYDDIELHRKKLYRIYDTISSKAAFQKFEKEIQKIFSEFEGSYSSSNLIFEIGKWINDEESIVRQAYEKGVPIFVPAIEDSILGLQIWMNGKIKIDANEDLKKIHEIVYELKRKKQKSGAIILGGGVPKNYAFQAALIPEKPFDYVIQITMARVEDGGLSGASLEEAKSWGKISENAKTVTVPAEVTMAFPIIVTAVRERLNKN